MVIVLSQEYSYLQRMKNRWCEQLILALTRPAGVLANAAGPLLPEVLPQKLWVLLPFIPRYWDALHESISRTERTLYG